MKILKEKFYIFQEDLISLEPLEKLVCISEIVMRLNELFCAENMKKLRTEIITDYLQKNKYLEVNDNQRKIPTKRGNILGIVTEERKNSKGDMYEINLYNIKAQQYIFDHLYDML